MRTVTRRPRTSPGGGSGSLFTPDNLAYGAQQAYKVYRAYKNYTKTPPASLKKIMPKAYKYRKGSGGHGSIAGGFSSGKSVVGEKVGVYLSKGVVKTKETSLIMNNNDCVVVGHSTRIPQEEYLMIARALLKKLVIQDLDFVDNFNSTISLGVAATLTLAYYLDPTTVTLSTGTVTIALTDTYEVVAIALAGLFNGILNAGGNRVQFTELLLNKSVDTVFIRFARIDLSSTMITYFCNSSLKIQNRSTNEVDEDIEVVDQVPIVGHSYEGKGNGAILKGNRFTPANPIIADESTGLIQGSSTGVPINALKEPPAPKAFAHVTGYSKVSLEPGNIKTSDLRSEWTQSFNTWFAELQRVGAGYSVSNYRLCSKGLFRFFAMEKMISIAGETPVILGVEVNQKYGCYIDHKMNTVTQEIVN